MQAGWDERGHRAGEGRVGWGAHERGAARARRSPPGRGRGQTSIRSFPQPLARPARTRAAARTLPPAGARAFRREMAAAAAETLGTAEAPAAPAPGTGGDAAKGGQPQEVGAIGGEAQAPNAAGGAPAADAAGGAGEGGEQSPRPAEDGGGAQRAAANGSAGGEHPAAQTGSGEAKGPGVPLPWPLLRSGGGGGGEKATVSRAALAVFAEGDAKCVPGAGRTSNGGVAAGSHHGCSNGKLAHRDGPVLGDGSDGAVKGAGGAGEAATAPAEGTKGPVVWGALLEAGEEAKMLASMASDAAKKVELEVAHASEANFMEAELMPVLGQSPLSERLDLVVCGDSQRVVLRSCFSAHYAQCEAYRRDASAVAKHAEGALAAAAALGERERAQGRKSDLAQKRGTTPETAAAGGSSNGDFVLPTRGEWLQAIDGLRGRYLDEGNGLTSGAVKRKRSQAPREKSRRKRTDAILADMGRQIGEREDGGGDAGAGGGGSGSSQRSELDALLSAYRSCIRPSAGRSGGAKSQQDHLFSYPTQEDFEDTTPQTSGGSVDLTRVQSGLMEPFRVAPIAKPKASWRNARFLSFLLGYFPGLEQAQLALQQQRQQMQLRQAHAQAQAQAMGLTPAQQQQLAQTQQRQRQQQQQSMTQQQQPSPSLQQQRQQAGTQQPMVSAPMTQQSMVQAAMEQAAAMGQLPIGQQQQQAQQQQQRRQQSLGQQQQLQQQQQQQLQQLQQLQQQQQQQQQQQRQPMQQVQLHQLTPAQQQRLLQRMQAQGLTPAQQAQMQERIRRAQEARAAMNPLHRTQQSQLSQMTPAQQQQLLQQQMQQRGLTPAQQAHFQQRLAQQQQARAQAQAQAQQQQAQQQQKGQQQQQQASQQHPQTQAHQQQQQALQKQATTSNARPEGHMPISSGAMAQQVHHAIAQAQAQAMQAQAMQARAQARAGQQPQQTQQGQQVPPQQQPAQMWQQQPQSN